MNRTLKYALALSCSLLAVAAHAAKPRGIASVRGAKPPFMYKANLANHGGPVIVTPKVVFIFWGPSFNNVASPDYAYAQELRSYRNQLGATPEFNVITQYSGIELANLGAGTPDWFDTSTPPTNVTDATVQSKVNQYLSLYPVNASAIYEVVLPSASYSSSGSQTSCGGPNVQYCAYHSYFTSGSTAVKYSIQPYPSCSGCQAFGWTAAQNQEHFVLHETRETVTDPQLNAWYDGNLSGEADDKCNWTPTPFIGTGGYGYQYEWSNAGGGCVQSIAVSGPPPPGNPFIYANASDERQACYGIAGRVSSSCDSIGDFNDRQMCYALAQSSQTPCTQITDRNLQLSCYGIAFKPNFPSNCRDITDTDMRRFCYGAAGVSITDIGNCTQVSARNTQLLCFAMNDFISSNCNDITNANDRQFCFGVSSHDTSYCANIL
ncbi:MAG TPA: hypothetical protein VF173_31405 [Thermoanaerobaculia bacterium]|nr:hypothetical protein [Thermoanaerobaculia bacterium]